MKTRYPLILFSAALVLSSPLYQSCDKSELADDNEQPEWTDQVQVSFKLFTPSSSRATSVQDFKTIWVMDLLNNRLLQTITQSAEDDNFGNPTLSLVPGVHLLRFFATDAPQSAFENNIITQVPLGDSFYKSVLIDTKNATGTQRVLLERQVAKIVYKGSGTETLNGVVTQFNLKDGNPEQKPQSVTMQTDDFIYTYIPTQENITLSNGTKVPVKKNGVTVINVSGGGGENPIVPPGEETMILDADTAVFYLAKKEIEVTSLEKIPDPRTTYRDEMLPYRMPTRREALTLNKIKVPQKYWSGTRCLCYDSPDDAGYAANGFTLGTGAYYTFKWNGEGSVTEAGQSTRYCIKPIRTVPVAPVSIPTGIDADFTWETDTTMIN